MNMQQVCMKDCADNHCLLPVFGARRTMAKAASEVVCGANHLEAHQNLRQTQEQFLGEVCKEDTLMSGSDLSVAEREARKRSPRLVGSQATPCHMNYQLEQLANYEQDRWLSKLQSLGNDIVGWNAHKTTSGHFARRNGNQHDWPNECPLTVPSSVSINYQMQLTNILNLNQIKREPVLPNPTVQEAPTTFLCARRHQTRVNHQLIFLLAVCLTSIQSQPTEAATGPEIANSRTKDSQLARQLIDIHQRNQLLKHIQNNQAAASQQADAPLVGWPSQQNSVISGQQRIDNDRNRATHDTWKSPGSTMGDVPSPGQQSANLPEYPNNVNTGRPTDQMHKSDAKVHDFVMSQQNLPRPTMPTLNKQLIGPPQPDTPFYELGFATTNALQLDLPVAHQEHTNHLNQPQVPTVTTDNRPQERHRHHRHHHEQQQQQRQPQTGNNLDQHNQWQHSKTNNPGLQAAESFESPQFVLQDDQARWVPQPALAMMSGAVAATTTRPRDSRSMFPDAELSFGMMASKEANGESSNSNQANSDGQQSGLRETTEAKRDTDNNTERSQSTRSSIEPRQRRRIFNRILKKAEWNHLFLELSKVFLRYFLDLALKDIIGKQSGAAVSDSSTTGRKKLDAQSELADMLKDFVKTAISNI